MLRCNKIQDYFMLRCILIDSMKSLIASSYFQPRYIPNIIPSINQIIIFYRTQI